MGEAGGTQHSTPVRDVGVRGQVGDAPILQVHIRNTHRLFLFIRVTLGVLAIQVRGNLPLSLWQIMMNGWSLKKLEGHVQSGGRFKARKATAHLHLSGEHLSPNCPTVHRKCVLPKKNPTQHGFPRFEFQNELDFLLYSPGTPLWAGAFCIKREQY